MEGVVMKREERFAAFLDTVGAIVFFTVAFLCYLALSVAWGAGMP
jgi:hypothetical protein